jgi:hypothetical protein
MKASNIKESFRMKPYSDGHHGMNSKKRRRHRLRRMTYENRLRKQRTQQQRAARKRGHVSSPWEGIKWRLENRLLRTNLNSALCSMLRKHRNDATYDILSAFGDALVNLRPESDASKEAWKIAKRAGVPFYRLHSREELLEWFQERTFAATSGNSGNVTLEHCDQEKTT